MIGTLQDYLEEQIDILANERTVALVKGQLEKVEAFAMIKLARQLGLDDEMILARLEQNIQGLLPQVARNYLNEYDHGETAEL